MKKIILKPNQNLWWTSDSHFSHRNICRGTSSWDPTKNLTRDFDTLEEMNAALVDNINHFVQPDDILIHLGDWSFGGFDEIEKFRSQLNVADIRIMLGNHDHHIQRNKQNIRSIFTEVWEGIQNIQVLREGQSKKEATNFVVSHYPIASWQNMNDGWIHLHGHVHLPKQHIRGQGKSLDVGVDGNNLVPWHLDEILTVLRNQPIKHLRLPQDHHED